MVTLRGGVNWSGSRERRSNGGEERKTSSVPIDAVCSVEHWSLAQDPASLAALSRLTCRQRFGVRDTGFRLPVQRCVAPSMWGSSEGKWRLEGICLKGAINSSMYYEWQAPNSASKIPQGQEAGHPYSLQPRWLCCYHWFKSHNVTYAPGPRISLCSLMAASMRASFHGASMFLASLDSLESWGFSQPC